MTTPESNDVTHKLIGASDQTGPSAGFQPGQQVGGRYQVIARLGKGGMGVVYRVKQIFINKEFALKTIDKHCMSDTAIRRFQHEARAGFAVDHPNIIAVNDFGVLDDQTPFLVMEIVNGETLGERLKRTRCLTVEEAIPIFAQVCFGLAYAHKCGVVHRDIKPNNIMLLKGLSPDAEGSVKIVDFGIAKFTEHEGGEIQALTRTGEIFGSPSYMSPEQCSGVRVDHRADIYSLGCVLFEALTGTPPFMGDNALSTMMRHQSEPPPTLKQATLGAEFPKVLEEIVAKMLAKSPDSRYTSLAIVAHDLGTLRHSEGISPFVLSVPQREATISMGRTSFYALTVGIAVLSAAIAGVSGYLLHYFQSPKTDSTVPVENVLGVTTEKAKVPDQLDYQVISEEALKQLLAQPMKRNSEFTIRHSKLSDKSINLIANYPWIRILDFSDCDISNDSLRRLARLKDLWKIDLSNSTFNDVGAEKLSACQGLTYVKAGSTDLSDTGVCKLAALKPLQTLIIEGAKITDQSLVALAKCKELRSLDILGVNGITTQGISALEHTHLTELLLESTPIDDVAMSHICQMADLRIVSLNRTKVTIKGIQELCKSKSLHTIWLIRCPNLSPADIHQLRLRFRSIQFRDKERRGSDEV